MADSRSPRDGRFIEIVGTYDPRPDPSEIKVDNDKAVAWLRNGAQPSERVEKLLPASQWEYLFPLRDKSYTYTGLLQAMLPSFCSTRR